MTAVGALQRLRAEALVDAAARAVLADWLEAQFGQRLGVRMLFAHGSGYGVGDGYGAGYGYGYGAGDGYGYGYGNDGYGDGYGDGCGG